MIQKILCLVILMSILLSCSTGKKSNKTKLDKFKNEKIDSLVNRYLDLNRFSGVVIVAEGDSIVYNKSYGLADYENEVHFSDKTVFKIGTISELVTAGIIQEMAEGGKFELSDKKDEADLAIGYLYHNYRGEGLELQRAPVTDTDVSFSSSGLESTATDVLKIISSDTTRDLDIAGYVEDDGFSYSLVYDIKTKISLVVLSNRRHPVAKEISSSINAILKSKEYSLPLLRKPVEIDESLLKDYTGFYSLNENMTLEIINESDSLFVMMGPNRIHLVPQSQNQFYMEQMDASMRFLRGADNAVKEAILLNGFLEGDKIMRIEK